MKYLTNSGLSYFLNKIKAYIASQLNSKANLTHTHNASDITSGLATVATSGSYNDLSNKPTIPTVNNATLTIQKNGTTVKTFTANASSNVTANITVPTKTSDLTNDSGFLTSHQDLSGYIPLSGTNALSGSIVPSTNNSYNLGDSSHNYASVYAYNFPTFMRAMSPSDSTDIFLIAGTDIFYGAYLQLSSKDTDTTSGSTPGGFRLTARSANNQSDLIGIPNGTLTWGSKNVAMLEDVVPRSGGAVMTGDSLARTIDNSLLKICGGTAQSNGGTIALYGKDTRVLPGTVVLQPALSSSSYCNFILYPDGTATWCGKNLAMQEDVIPRSGGAVMTGGSLGRIVDNGTFELYGGTGWGKGSIIVLYGKDQSGFTPTRAGAIQIVANNDSGSREMILYPDGTWTWSGTAVQLVSDQRLKQQITEIDDKLLDAWEDVNLVQFKYNDAVEQKGDNARLHTGYVVQQIDSACKSHNVDISEYGLYCHEEYPQETEEVEVTQEDGTKTKEKKVIREASEHYSLRYTETLVVECAYLRKRIKELEERLEKLEGNSK